MRAIITPESTSGVPPLSPGIQLNDVHFSVRSAVKNKRYTKTWHSWHSSRIFAQKHTFKRMPLGILPPTLGILGTLQLASNSISPPESAWENPGQLRCE